MRLTMTSAAKRRDLLEGLPVVLRYIARAGGRSFLYGTDALTACQVHANLLPAHDLLFAQAARHRGLCLSK